MLSATLLPFLQVTLRFCCILTPCCQKHFVFNLTLIKSSKLSTQDIFQHSKFAIINDTTNIEEFLHL